MKDKILKIVNSKYFYILLIFALGVVALINRFYKITDIPYGIHVDEAGMGYDAWCLANFGVDRYLIKYPVYLINFASGQSAMAAYISSFFIKLSGGNLSLFALRAPMAVMGLLTIIFGGLTFKEVLGKWLGLLGTTLLVICPYFMMQSRFGLDCNYMLGCSTIAMFFIIKAIRKQKNSYWFLSGVFLGLTMYTYAISYAVLLVFLVLLISCLFYFRKINLKSLICMGIPTFLLALPLILFVLINYLEWDSIVTPFFTIPRMPVFRGSEFSLDSDVIISNIRTIISALFFYDGLRYNALPKFGTLYVVSVPFAVLGVFLGVYYLIREIEQRKYHVSMPFTLFFISVIAVCCCLQGSGPNINKMNAVFFTLAYFVVIGLHFTYFHIGKIKNVFAGGIAVLYAIFFFTFTRYYFTIYPTHIYPQAMFEMTCEEALEYIKENDINCKIYYDFDQQGYIYYLMSNLQSPYDFPVEIDMANYKNNYFKLPETIEEKACYVVKETNTDYMEQLENSFDFTKEKVGAYFIFY